MSLFELGPAPFYAPPAGRRDEMVDELGEVRPSWDRVHGSLLGTGPEALRRGAARIGRTLHSHGTTFQPNGSGQHRWDLDPIPLVVERSDWSRLGHALAQRARVLELLLADIFGEQRLLRSGVLPTDAILSHRDYLRPCIGVPPGGERHLVLYAADVARGADGAFTVISDRTQAPSGAGYALENREVMSAAFPDLVRRSGVEALRPWFSALRITLAEVAPPGVDDPRIVILTPGPLSETYFEHGFLSRTLGYTLVEPADLTVRDGHVWLKSVTGLEPVHVILRREDAEWCDSLELRPDSLLGVPGLVEAARRRNVSIVNPLGSGLAENPALLPYLGELTRTLLGEEPLIGSAPSWWCGEPAGRSHVLAHLDSLVVKHVQRGATFRNVFGRTLDQAGRDELRARIEAHPHLFVGQEEQLLPTAPALDGDTIVPRYTVQRAFLVADAGGFSYMDGGLTSTAADPGDVRMSAGGTSKDTWVVASAQDAPWSSRRPAPLPQVDLRASVTSRAAESMYWIGRNLERSETVIRVVRSIEQSLTLWPELRDEAGGTWLRTVESAVAAIVDEPVGDGALDSSRGVLTDALVDARRPRSLVTSLSFLLAGGRSVRELLSTDSWRMLSELDLLHLRLSSGSDAEVREAAEATIAPLSALSGLMMESMVRDPGWKFLDLGRRIERSLLLSQILRATMLEPLAETIAAPLYETVLSGWECLGAYRRRHRSDIERRAMLALLFTDQSNPRSVRFQVERMVEDLDGLPDVGGDDGLRSKVTALLDELTRLASDPDALRRLGAENGIGRSQALAELLGTLDRELGEIADLAELGYFAQVGPGRVIGDDEGYWEPVQ
jgi:uncharacterized circularly permuted ATP-grasp superfamily protein/uncharacterized alpha-E superfamily protein